MIAIDVASNDPKRPYANLLPIVTVLVEAGNCVVDGGFRLTQGGWDCVLEEPIDFELLAKAVSLPPTIDGSADHDQILDRLSWCAITGGAAMARIQAQIDESRRVTFNDAD